MVTYKMEMELEVGPLENKDCNSLIVKTIKDKYEGEQVTAKSLELTLYKIDNNFVATKSKKFNFNGSQWHAKVSKLFLHGKNFFTVQLYCDKAQAGDWSSKLSGTFKLMPLDEKKFGNFGFDRHQHQFIIYLMEWSKLERQFVEHKTVEMMLELKVEQHQTNEFSM